MGISEAVGKEGQVTEEATTRMMLRQAFFATIRDTPGEKATREQDYALATAAAIHNDVASRATYEGSLEREWA